MKKIGIITITDYKNLGNRLQNYASQEILKTYGEVRTIKRFYNFEKMSHFHSIFSNLKYKIKNIIKLVIKKNINQIKREKSFFKFNNFINEGYRLNKNTNFKKLDSKFDVFVAGSDQVWNPVFFNDNMYINMLGFTTKEKKLAISPSVAIETLSLNQVKEFKDKLKDFDYLSCREQQGADLIKNITGKDCVALIDPTLMLSADKWDKVSRKPKFHDDRKNIYCYIF